MHPLVQKTIYSVAWSIQRDCPKIHHVSPSIGKWQIEDSFWVQKFGKFWYNIQFRVSLCFLSKKWQYNSKCKHRIAKFHTFDRNSKIKIKEFELFIHNFPCYPHDRKLQNKRFQFGLKMKKSFDLDILPTNCTCYKWSSIENMFDFSSFPPREQCRHHDGPLKYKLPLRSCNTMPQETVRSHKLLQFFVFGSILRKNNKPIFKLSVGMCERVSVSFHCLFIFYCCKMSQFGGDKSETL